jgi:hypothetical protein
MAKKKSQAVEPEEAMIEIDPETGSAPGAEVEKPQEEDRRFSKVESDIEVEVAEEEEEEVEAPKPREDEKDKAQVAAFEALIRKIEGIQVGGQQVTLPVKDPEESEEEFASRFNEEVFKDDPYGNVSKAVDRRTRKLLEEQVAPLLGSIMEDAFENQVFRLKNDAEEGEIFKTYEDEIKKILKTLPPAQQKNPQVLKRVFENVKASHINEIIDLKVKAQLGKTSPEKGPSKRPPLTEGGSSMVPGNGAKKTIRIPASELDQLQRQASRMGVDVAVLIERRKAR